MRNLRSRAKLFRSSETTGLLWEDLVVSGSSRLRLGIPDQSWGPGTGTLGGTPGRGWDHLGPASRRSSRPHLGASHQGREHPASSQSTWPRLSSPGRSLIGYGAVRLRLGRPVSVRVDKDVLFTSVMTFFRASIEMGWPPPPSECLPWFSPGRSRHGFPQGLYGVGFPRVFTS